MVDAGQTMVYELNVGMTCDGCSGAIERILGAKPGKYFNKQAPAASQFRSVAIYLFHFVVVEITSVQCDVAGQKVLVEGQDGLDIAAMLQVWSESAQKSVEYVGKTAKA